MFNCFGHNCLDSFVSSFFSPMNTISCLERKALEGIQNSSRACQNASKFPRRSCWKWLGKGMSAPTAEAARAPICMILNMCGFFPTLCSILPLAYPFFSILFEGKREFTGNCLIDAVPIVWAQPEVVSLVHEFPKTTLPDLHFSSVCVIHSLFYINSTTRIRRQGRKEAFL